MDDRKDDNDIMLSSIFILTTFENTLNSQHGWHERWQRRHDVIYLGISLHFYYSLKYSVLSTWMTGKMTTWCRCHLSCHLSSLLLLFKILCSINMDDMKDGVVVIYLVIYLHINYFLKYFVLSTWMTGKMTTTSWCHLSRHLSSLLLLFKILCIITRARTRKMTTTSCCHLSSLFILTTF